MWKIRFICWSGSSIDWASIRTMASKDTGNAARNSSSKGKGPAKSPTLASKLRKKVDDIEDCWSPASWSEVLDNIRTMRAARDAPVDSMGAEVFMKDPGARDPKAGRLHVLVSLMLSSQTRDEVNHAAMARLREAGLSVPWLRAVPEPELAQLVKPVGFWRRKAQYLKAAAEMLDSEFDGDIPAAISDLCRLPGVGPKMAHLTINIAWRQICGIGVDTHVHRISNRLGWTRRPTANPEDPAGAGGVAASRALGRDKPADGGPRAAAVHAGGAALPGLSEPQLVPVRRRGLSGKTARRLANQETATVAVMMSLVRCTDDVMERGPR